MADTKPTGRFVWFDLMTTDPAKAIDFYTKVTGWSTVKWEGPGDYIMWTNSSQPLGGVVALAGGAPAPPHWMAFISTPDVDATFKQAESLGATGVVAPKDIPTVGRYAVLKDPQGAVFAIFTSSSQAPGHEGEPEVGEFSWHELATSESPAAFRFYEQLFGWNKGTGMDMGPLGIYQIFSRNSRDMGGIYNRPPELPGPMWVHYIRVNDINRAAETVKANGGQVVNGPMEVPGGDWILNGVDPQGAMFALHAKPK